MEERYKGKFHLCVFVCVFLFLAGNLSCDPHLFHAASATRHQTLNAPATVTLYTIERGATRCYSVSLSVDDATAMTNLLGQYIDMKNNLSAGTTTDQRELLSALRQHWMLPEEALRNVLSVCSTLEASKGHPLLSWLFHGRIPLYEKKETVVKSSITSTGTGILIPRELGPRPRLTTIWRVDAGKTFAINMDTKYGMNATGPHLGVAVGFVGFGFSSRVPNQQRYVLVGGALVTVLYGDTITPIVPS